MLFAPEGHEHRVALHAGAILSSAADGKRIVTGGDDGQVIATTADGTHSVVATDEKRRWIDHVALGPDGAVAWSAGKTAYVRPKNGEVRSFDAPSTVAGLAFAPKGLRWPSPTTTARRSGSPMPTGARPETLEWKGSHLGVAFSPDGKFLITTMQEPMLHGWRLADCKAHAHVRLFGARALAVAGPRAANSSPPPAPSNSSSGRSTARTGRWASSRC